MYNKYIITITFYINMSPKHNQEYEKQKELLKNIINGYRKSTKLFSQHGYFGCMAATYLLGNIITNCEKIKNCQAKSYILRTQLKNFVAYGRAHALLPCSSTTSSGLRGYIATRFFQKAPNEINQLINKWKQKDKNRLNEESRKELDQKRVELNIPLEGVPYTFAHKIAEASYKINLIPSLYSHFKLKVKNGMPTDVFNQELPDGIYQFVVLTNNEFRFLPTKLLEKEHNHYESFIKYRAHHQVAGGKNVYSAGNFEIRNKKIIWLDGGSGHYATEKIKFIDYAVSLLNTIGIDTTGIEKVDRKSMDSTECFNRIVKNFKWFFQGLFGEKGEKIQNRPSTENICDNKIPQF